MPQQRILVDTNVWLRAVQSTHPDQALAKSALLQLATSGVEICITPQVIYELWVVITRPQANNGLGLAPREARLYIDNVLAASSLLPDPATLVDTWLSIIVSFTVTGKPAHDARLAAAMKEHALQDILTFNTTDFTRFPFIRVVQPR